MCLIKLIPQKHKTGEYITYKHTWLQGWHHISFEAGK